jgi:site-specific DNA recombinase
MTPSHSRKKRVRYRYYVSQAVLQSRKAQAGQVFRVPAPDIEALIERFLQDRCRDPQGDLRALVEAQIARITVQPDSISVEIASPSGTLGGEASQLRQIVSLPWSKKPFRADKGVVSAPEADARAKEAVLTAIGKARRWVGELMAGGSLAGIARQEGKGERQIRMLVPLAFVPPSMVQRYADGSVPVSSVTELARTVPLIWQKY